MTDLSKTTSLDSLTVVAVGVLAYLVANVLHEAVGHGGSCLVLGGEAVSLSTAHFEHLEGTLGDTPRRLVAALGSVVNLVAGLMFWGLYRALANAAGPVRYFLWLSFAINLFKATGYLLFSGALGVGDWNVVTAGYEPVWVWRVGLGVAGAALYFACVVLALRELSALLGDDERRHKRALKLTVLPYVTGSTASMLGAFLNPYGFVLVFTSAAASFGATSALAWMVQLYKGPRFPASSAPALVIQRNWVWIGVAIVAVACHIAILGPSVRFDG